MFSFEKSELASVSEEGLEGPRAIDADLLVGVGQRLDVSAAGGTLQEICQ